MMVRIVILYIDLSMVFTLGIWQIQLKTASSTALCCKHMKSKVKLNKNDKYQY